MSLTDQQIVANIESSVALLRPLAVLLTATPESSPKYTKYGMIEAIDTLKRLTAADPRRQIKELTVPPVTVAKPDLTPEQVEAEVLAVLALLDPVVTRLNIQAMADESYTYAQVKKACDILSYRKLPRFDPTLVIQEKTVKYELNRNYVFKPAPSRVIV